LDTTVNGPTRVTSQHSQNAAGGCPGRLHGTTLTVGELIALADGEAVPATDAYAAVLACELVTAVRPLRMHSSAHPHPHPVPPPVAAFALATASLPAGTEDRPLTGDVTTATEPLPVLSEL
jgi:hypothetical protein